MVEDDDDSAIPLSPLSYLNPKFRNLLLSPVDTPSMLSEQELIFLSLSIPGDENLDADLFPNSCDRKLNHFE